MGRGDNRKTLKVRQRRARLRKKLRLKRKIEEGKELKRGGGARRPQASSPSTIRRPAE